MKLLMFLLMEDTYFCTIYGYAIGDVKSLHVESIVSFPVHWVITKFWNDNLEFSLFLPKVLRSITIVAFCILSSSLWLGFWVLFRNLGCFVTGRVGVLILFFSKPG